MLLQCHWQDGDISLSWVFPDMKFEPKLNCRQAMQNSALSKERALKGEFRSKTSPLTTNMWQKDQSSLPEICAAGTNLLSSLFWAEILSRDLIKQLGQHGVIPTFSLRGNPKMAHQGVGIAGERRCFHPACWRGGGRRWWLDDGAHLCPCN